MDVTEAFGQFCKEVFPDETIELNPDVNTSEFESFYPSIVHIIQKDNTFFSVERIVFGKNLSIIDESKRDAIWKNLLPCMLGSFFHGDIKKKVDKISGIIKDIWNASGQTNDGRRRTRRKGNERVGILRRQQERCTGSCENLGGI